MVGGVSYIHLAVSYTQSVSQCKVVRGPSLCAVRCHKYNTDERRDPIFKNVEIVFSACRQRIDYQYLEDSTAHYIFGVL